MECMHRSDAKFQTANRNSENICVICMAEILTNGQKCISERTEYAHACLAFFRHPISKTSFINLNIQILSTAFKVIWNEYLLITDVFAKVLLQILSELLSYLTIDEHLLQLILSPLTCYSHSEDEDLNEKCNCVLLVASVIDNNEISFENAINLILDKLLPLMKRGNHSIQGITAYCIGILLRHANVLEQYRLSQCCDVLVDCLCEPKDEVLVSQNAFECIRLIVKFPESLNIVVTNQKFPNALRLHLTSHKSTLKEACLKFLGMLITVEQHDCIINFLSEIGILNFVYDCFSDQTIVAKAAVSFLIGMTKSESFMSTNMIPYALDKILSINIDMQIEKGFHRLCIILIERIFLGYTGSMELFLSLTTVENLFVFLQKELDDQDSSFSEISRCFLGYLSSKQLFRPFPLQLFLGCLEIYIVRLKQSIAQISSTLSQYPEMMPFTGSTVNPRYRKFEEDLSKSLITAIDIQLYLSSVLLFLDENCFQEEFGSGLISAFNYSLNSAYFTLPLDIIWKSFAHERTPFRLLQNMLSLSCKIIRKGFLETKTIECSLIRCKNSSNYAQKFYHVKVKETFMFIFPLILDEILRARNMQCDSQISLNSSPDKLNEPSQFSTSILQLICYVISTGCISFGLLPLDIVPESTLEYQQFWQLVLNGIPRVPGASLNTLCLLLEDLNQQPIEDGQSDAGSTFPAVLAIVSCLINRIVDMPSLPEGSSSVTTAIRVDTKWAVELLPRLSDCLLRAGLKRLLQLSPIFAVELLASFSISRNIGVEFSSSEFQALNLLAEALVNRLQVEHTRCLLAVESFSTFLLLGDSGWIVIAQKMIYHCHSHPALLDLGLSRKLATTYEFLSLTWSVWISILQDLEKQDVVQRLATTFENGLESLESSKRIEGTATPVDQTSPNQNQIVDGGAVQLGAFIAGQLTSLPVKLELPIGTLFYQEDTAFHRNFVSMLTIVTRVEGLFSNSVCLHRIVETILVLLTDARCEMKRDVSLLLPLLNRCLLMTAERTLVQITPMIIQKLETSKPHWLYINRNAVDISSTDFDWLVHIHENGTSLPIIEEIIVLGTLMLFGHGQMPPIKDVDAFWIPVFGLPDILLHGMRGDIACCVPQRACCAASCFCLLSPTPPFFDEDSRIGQGLQFCQELLVTLYSNLMDLTLKPLMFLQIALFGKTLKIGRSIATDDDFGDSVWNMVVMEHLLLDVEFNRDQFPCSPRLIAFLAELLSNTSWQTVVDLLDAKQLQDIVLFYARMQPSSCPTGLFLFLQKLVFQISHTPVATFLSCREKDCLRYKLQTEGYIVGREACLFEYLESYKNILLSPRR